MVYDGMVYGTPPPHLHRPHLAVVAEKTGGGHTLLGGSVPAGETAAAAASASMVLPYVGRFN